MFSCRFLQGWNLQPKTVVQDCNDAFYLSFYIWIMHLYYFQTGGWRKLIWNASKIGIISDLSSRFHGLLVLFGETCEHWSLEATWQSNERQKAKDQQCELPAEVEGNDKCNANVCQRVDDHADLWARSLGGREQWCHLTQTSGDCPHGLNKILIHIRFYKQQTSYYTIISVVYSQTC